MASPEVLDFSQLLAPIPGDNPAGEDLRLDYSPTAPYRELRGARDRAREAERHLLYKGGEDDHGQAVPLPDWRPIVQVAPKLLAERSKDLEITALLIEGLVRKHGFAGLRDGFRLARELIERYWELLYPLPDEDGIRTRVIPLVRLNGEEGEGLLADPISRAPITSGKAAGEFSAAEYRQAMELDAIQDPDKRERRLAVPGVVTLQAFAKSVSQTPREFFVDLLDDLDQCSAAFKRLCELLEERCGTDESGYPLAPPSSNIRAALQSVRDDVVKIAGNVASAGSAAENGAGENGQTAMTTMAAPIAIGGAACTREDAFRALLQVADFFKRTEPHSPVSYALEQAVRWGRMSLPELLEELIPEDAARSQLFKLVGIASRRHDGNTE